MTSENIEWAEHTLLHQVNEAKKDRPVRRIVVGELDAMTPIAQEFLDFLQRLIKDGELL